MGLGAHGTESIGGHGVAARRRATGRVARQAATAILRLLVYAACIAVPWTAIGIGCVVLGGCVSGLTRSGPIRSGPIRSGPIPSGPMHSGLMRSGTEPVVPPRLAFYLADPEKFPRPAHEKDCNDYAVKRAAALRAQGLDPYFVVAIVETGEGHVVTALDRDGETLVYDNRLPEPDSPIPWHYLRYRWIERERAGHLWYPIIDARP